MPRKRLNHPAYRTFFRWCGVASALGGVLFVVWGYTDRPSTSENPGAVVQLMAFVVPALFLAGVIGLCALWGRRLGMLGCLGVVLAVYGSSWGVVTGMVGSKSVWTYFAQREWPHYLSDWLLLMLTGLALIGTATVRKRASLGTGALALALGAFGWIYDLTDTGAVLEVRSVHIGFGLLFGLVWVALGVGLYSAGSRPAPRSQVRGNFREFQTSRHLGE